MTQASARLDVSTPPDVVWSVIGGFNSLPDWIPAIRSSELTDGGRVRHFTLPDGQPCVERLVSFDDAARTYTYAIVRGPFPIVDYISTLRVFDMNGGKASRVEWSGRFTPNGVSEQEAARIVQGIYDGGLKALASSLASGTR
jgi:hypothetical protein